MSNTLQIYEVNYQDAEKSQHYCHHQKSIN